MSEQQLDSQPIGAVNLGPHLGEAQQADPRKVTTEPFAYFQFNEGWDMWEQVAHEHRYEEGVVPAYRSPAINNDEAFARGVEAAAKVAETVSTIGPTNEMWANGSQYTRTRIAAAIHALATTPARNTSQIGEG